MFRKFIFLVVILHVCMNSAFAEFEKPLRAPEVGTGYTKKDVVTGKDYMVVSGSYLSSKIGKEILDKGGNAIDALIAVQMVLNVIEPQSSGIGGGAFLLYYDAKKKAAYSFDGRETAPENSNPKMFLDKNGKPIYFFDIIKGGVTVGTPGLLKLLKKVHSNFGKLPWKELFKPAISIASNGFEISPRLHYLLKAVPNARESKTISQLFYDKNLKPKAAGSIIKNKPFAKLLTRISKEGISAFYEGSVAKNIVSTVQNSEEYPGTLSLDDLRRYKSKERKPLCSTYREYKICGVPLPSSGSIAILQTLGILENFDIASMHPYSSDAVNIISQAMNLAYADKNTFLADPDFVDIPVSRLMDKRYLKKRSLLINTKFSNKTKFSHGDIYTDFNTSTPFFERPSTTHMSIIDKEGNAVSMTSSIEFAFGSSLMVDGFLLNSQLTDFSFEPIRGDKLVANRIEKGKRPLSSMSPIMVFDKNNNLKLVIGSPGGPRIISYIVNVIISVFDWNFTLQQAINAPHYVSLNQGYIELENNKSVEYLRNYLKSMGHYVILKQHTSGLHGILVKDNMFFSGVDPRREGAAFAK